MKAKGLQRILRCIAVITASLILICNAHAATQYKVLHYFGNRPARVPIAGLVADLSGNLYGTTLESPPHLGCNGPDGCGTVYRLVRQPDGTWSYNLIHLFHGPDGVFPTGRLTLDSLGNLFGTTEYGGTQTGTVFEVSPSGTGWEEKVLYNFGNSHQDGVPFGALTMNHSGNLYGGQVGGPNGRGGIFQLKRSGDTWQESVIHQFNATDGDTPRGDMAWDSAGNLYGTTILGGAADQGVVFQLTPVAGGGWNETVLYSFTANFSEAESAWGVIIDAAGNLYGATGGTNSCQAGCGTVYQLTPSQGGWTHTVLHTFTGSDGSQPSGSLVLGSDGNLYGLTLQGGQFNQGVIFKLSKSGSSWTETVLHSFNGRAGANPEGSLMFDQQGILYGTASAGGLGKQGGYGVVFSFTP